MPVQTRPTGDATRREFFAVLAGAGLLAACGDDDPAPTTGAGPVDDTVTVDHAFGTSEIPTAPVRVTVANAYGTLSDVLALGLEPVAAATLGDAIGSYGDYRRFFTDFFPDGPDVTGIEAMTFLSGEVDLEQVALARPDVIVAETYDVEAGGGYEQFSRIAPTVARTFPDEEWSGPGDISEYRFLRALATVLDREDAAEARIAALDARIAAARDRIGPIGTVSVTQVNADGISVRGQGFLTAALVAALGGEVVPDIAALGTEDGIRADLSLERLDVLTGDSLIILASDDEDDARLADLDASNGLWRNLPAVAAGRVGRVDRLVGAGNFGTHSLEVVLDQLETFFGSR